MSKGPGEPRDISVLLRQVRAFSDDTSANDELLAAVYDELKRLAADLMRGERAGHTLQPTALLHEAYMRLIRQAVEWEDRAHFFGIAAQAMRRILVEHARRKHAAKRGGGLTRVTLDEQLALSEPDGVDILDLDSAIAKLERHDQRMVRLVELRVFAGMTAQEAARALGVSKRTADADWSFARMFLLRELSDGA